MIKERFNKSMKIRHLSNPQTSRLAIFTFSGNSIFLESGKAGSTKVTEKDFPNPEEAEKYLQKKEWEFLKKGFILKNDNPDMGEAFLHYFIGSAYTGCLSFREVPDGIYIYKHGWFNAIDDQQDFLLKIDNKGIIYDTIKLPHILPWNIQYSSEANSLFIDMDHFIYKYDLDKKRFYMLADRKKGRWASFVSVVGQKMAYATNQQLTVADIHGKVIFQKTFDLEIVAGFTPFCAVLSQKGDILAFHNKTGQIQLLNAENGESIGVINAGFNMASQMEFFENDTRLAIKETYGSWKMRYFDVKTGKEIHYPSLEVPGSNKQVDKFCFNKDQSKLVLLQQRGDAHVFEMDTQTLLHSFKVEHCVKNALPRFIGEILGVRTDYGCFSLYKV